MVRNESLDGAQKVVIRVADNGALAIVVQSNAVSVALFPIRRHIGIFIALHKMTNWELKYKTAQRL